MSTSSIEFLRHTLATISYRGTKVFRSAPQSFADIRIHESSKSAVEIVAHISDVLDCSVSILEGNPHLINAVPMQWDSEVERFYDSLTRLDNQLENFEGKLDWKRLFQGPLADALTHIGQLAMMRRLAGDPVVGENFYRAEVVIGEFSIDRKRHSFEN